jgi:hypothetical protein
VTTLSEDRLSIKLVGEHLQTGLLPKALALSTSRDPRDVEDGIGDDAEVTIENKASIIALATETHPTSGETATLLLTGDATAQDILFGLTTAELLTPGGAPYQCDILKVQHHAAEFNYTHDFAERVIAKHYVVSANGQFTNPDANVIRVMIENRAQVKPLSPFTVWFTCTVERAPEGSQPAMAAALEQAVMAAETVNAATPGLVTVRVLNTEAPYFDICTCRTADAASCRCAPADAMTTTLVPSDPQ